MDVLAPLIRIVLAAVFLLAAAGKLLDPEGSKDAVKAFGTPSAAVPIVAITLPILELLIALALIPSSFALYGAVAAVALLAIFIVVISVNLARGRRMDCHCFGQLHSAPIGPATLVRNALLAGAAIAVIAAGRPDTWSNWWDGLAPAGRMGIVVGGSLAIVAVAEAAVIWKLFVKYGQLLIRVEILESPDAPLRATADAPVRGHLVGAVAPPFALQGLHGETITLASLLAVAKPVLLLFTDPQCGPCGALIPEIAAWQSSLEGRVTLGVVSRGTTADNVAKFSAAGITGVLTQLDNEVSDAYLSPGTPSCVLIDQQGAIASELVAGADAIRRLVQNVSGIPSAPVAFTNGSHDHGHANGHAAPVRPDAVGKGEAAPSIELPDLDGRRVSLAEYAGHETFVVFWNPECGFCVQLLPQLLSWENERGPEAPQLLIVSTGSNEANRALGFHSAVLVDESFTAGAAFGAHGTPIGVLIDPEGRIASDLAIGGPAIMEVAERAHV